MFISRRLPAGEAAAPGVREPQPGLPGWRASAALGQRSIRIVLDCIFLRVPRTIRLPDKFSVGRGTQCSFARTVERGIFQESALYTCLSGWEKHTNC